MEGGGVDLNQTKQKCAAREQRNKYKPRTETRTTLSGQTRRQAGGFNIPPGIYSGIFFLASILTSYLTFFLACGRAKTDRLL